MQSDPTLTEAGRSEIKPIYVILAVLAALLIATALAIGIYFLARSFPAEIEAVRDLMIVLIAAASCVLGVAVVILLVVVIRLVTMLEYELKPILDDASRTVGTVRGTTSLVSNRVLRPVVRFIGYYSAIRKGVSVLFGRRR